MTRANTGMLAICVFGFAVSFLLIALSLPSFFLDIHIQLFQSFAFVFFGIGMLLVWFSK